MISEGWTSLKELINQYIGLSPDTMDKILWTVCVWIIYLILRVIASMIVHKRTEDMARRYIAGKTVGYVVGFIALIAMVRIWLGGITGLMAYFGILSAGIAIALQDPVTNLAGWIFLTTRKPFVVGDRIQIGEQAGDVIDIRLFQFSLVEIRNWVNADQSTGRIIHVPNGILFKQSVANYVQGFNFIWNELPITVTFESDWKKAKEVLSTIANEHSCIQSAAAEREVRKAARKYLIFFQHLTPIVWTSVADNGVTLTIRYLCEPRKRRSSETAIWEEVLTAFAKADDIDFAYPTTRFYHNISEGKPEARADDPHKGI
ncbi:MAG: mechanosensitive ion channel family protein [Verrucomicrobia bacterium]|nr:mechanosensitive ion channel family protein [Verrucomicrobiota bacterium]